MAAVVPVLGCTSDLQPGMQQLVVIMLEHLVSAVERMVRAHNYRIHIKKVSISFVEA